LLSLSLFAGSVFLLAVTVLAKVRLHNWWIRVCEFPRLQLAALALAIAALTPLIESPWVQPTVFVSLLVLALQAYRILPWTPLWRVQVKRADLNNTDPCVSLLISNVLTPNRNARGLVEQILRLQPDVVLTLESDQWWGDKLDDALAEDWPYSVKIPQDNLYGMHLYSRLALEDIQIKRLIQDDIPSIHAKLILEDGSKIDLHALHPRPPAPQESDESLWRDAELLLVGKEISASDNPALLIGDLNDVAWSRTTRLFSRVSGMLDPRRGRGMFSTFHAEYRLLRWPLDHIFITRHFTLASIKRLDKFGSDHFPIHATLCFTPEKRFEQEKPEEDQAEREAADDTIAEAKSRGGE